MLNATKSLILLYCVKSNTTFKYSSQLYVQFLESWHYCSYALLLYAGKLAMDGYTILSVATTICKYTQYH